ncbi:hypothetical protein RIF23_01095 [Lipingzhangella sp. LS1_29]|uniref:Secreted protein n=1 Tax=Lipingzhangella rawalii TaxID=2055835 RepID=A0ABU2H1Z7_9ACTN|nr:hypothetical protein [Lipingzhangella rawalii]MDS1268884.1 hypothetical protein [Lipingzhangella rawalii]
MGTPVAVGAGIIIAVLIGATILALVAHRWSRRSGLRSRFGPEYHRLVEALGSEREVDRELARREHRHRSFELRELSPRQRAEFAAEWQETRREFVEDPSRAVTAVSDLVQRLMTARAYPQGSVEQRMADLSVRYPHRVATLLRAQHQVQQAGTSASTEELRRLMRAAGDLITALLEAGHSAAQRPASNDADGPGVEPAPHPVTNPDPGTADPAGDPTGPGEAGR